MLAFFFGGWQGAGPLAAWGESLIGDAPAAGREAPRARGGREQCVSERELPREFLEEKKRNYS